jgi:hypothetical protein
MILVNTPVARLHEANCRASGSTAYGDFAARHGMHSNDRDSQPLADGRCEAEWWRARYTYRRASSLGEWPVTRS